MTTTLRRTLLAGAALALALPAFARDTDDGRGKELFKPGLGHAATQSAVADPTAPPLYAGLGAMGMTITTAQPEAQAYFDQAWGSPGDSTTPTRAGPRPSDRPATRSRSRPLFQHPVKGPPRRRAEPGRLAADYSRIRG